MGHNFKIFTSVGFLIDIPLVKDLANRKDDIFGYTELLLCLTNATY